MRPLRAPCSTPEPSLDPSQGHSTWTVVRDFGGVSPVSGSRYRLLSCDRCGMAWSEESIMMVGTKTCDGFQDFVHELLIMSVLES
jgi:hypothetical protein